MPFGKCRRVEDDEVESTFAKIFHVVFHIGHHARVLLNRISVEFKVGFSHSQGFFRGIDRYGTTCATFQGCDGETARVTESIKHSTAFGESPYQFAVLALVEEEARLLPFFPVGKIEAAILHNLLIQLTAEEVAVGNSFVFLTHTLHGLCAFVVDGLQSQLIHQLQGAHHLFQMKCHTLGLRLHHSGVSIDVDDESSQAVALRMDETVAVGMGIAHQTHAPAHLKSLFYPFVEKPLVDMAVIEAEHLHGDAVRLAKTCT